jgi:hypothetical protein
VIEFLEPAEEFVIGKAEAGVALNPLLPLAAATESEACKGEPGEG